MTIPKPRKNRAMAIVHSFYSFEEVGTPNKTAQKNVVNTARVSCSRPHIMAGCITKPVAAKKSPAAAAAGGSGSPWESAEMSTVPPNAVYIEACKS